MLFPMWARMSYRAWQSLQQQSCSAGPAPCLDFFSHSNEKKRISFLSSVWPFLISKLSRDIKASAGRTVSHCRWKKEKQQAANDSWSQCLIKKSLNFLFLLYWVIDAGKIAEFWFLSVSFTALQKKKQIKPLQGGLLSFTKKGPYLLASSKNYCIDSHQHNS